MDDSSQDKGKNPVIAGIIVVAILGLLVGGVIFFNKKDEEPTASTTSQSSSTSQPSSDTATVESATGTYKDGTYSATGSYNSPGGNERIAVELTVQGGKITSASATSRAVSPTGSQYQKQFIGGFKSEVVGKSVDDVELTTVSGSSLTPQGFNDALGQIKQQAKTTS